MFRSIKSRSIYDVKDDSGNIDMKCYAMRAQRNGVVFFVVLSKTRC